MHYKKNDLKIKKFKLNHDKYPCLGEVLKLFLERRPQFYSGLMFSLYDIEDASGCFDLSPVRLLLHMGRMQSKSSTSHSSKSQLWLDMGYLPWMFDYDQLVQCVSKACQVFR